MTKRNTQPKKTCIHCHKSLSIWFFGRDPGYKDGRRSDCNDCRNASRRASTRLARELISLPPIAPKDTFWGAAHLGGPLNPRVQLPELPAPEVLPAAYLKRCSDYWTDLLGGSTSPARIV